MRAQILASGVLFAVAGAYPVFGQALAEGALVHANSAAATAKAGTALGNALNKATTQLGQQMQTVTQTHVAGTPQSVPHTTAPMNVSTGPTAAPSSTTSGGPLTITVKGGQPSCAPAPASAAGSSGAAPQAQPCAAPVTTQTQSKSVVHVSFSQ